MGSMSFYESAVAKTAEDAYNQLCEERCYEHGHVYDSGHIGVSHGFEMTKLDQKKFTKAAFDRWYEKAMEETSKHGPCWCLELPRSKAKGYPRGYRRFVFAGWAAY